MFFFLLGPVTLSYCQCKDDDNGDDDDEQSQFIPNDDYDELLQMDEDVVDVDVNANASIDISS